MATQVSPVHNRPAHVLTPAEQRAAYDQDGYLVFRELLDATELAVLRSALGEVVRDAESLTETNDKFSITRTDGGGYSVRRIFDPIVRHERITKWGRPGREQAVGGGLMLERGGGITREE